MSHDAEDIIAAAIVTYLKSQVSAEIQTVCPIVSFTDPMSIDDAHRIVVRVPSYETTSENGMQFAARVEVVVKSAWSQTTRNEDGDIDARSIAQDRINHRARVVAVGDALWPTVYEDDEDLTLMPHQQLAARIEAANNSDSLQVDWTSQRRQHSTDEYDGFFKKEIAFDLAGHFKVTVTETTP